MASSPPGISYDDLSLVDAHHQVHQPPLSDDELSLDREAHDAGDLLPGVSLWDDVRTVADMFSDASGGALMAAKVAKYFFRLRGYTQQIFADPAEFECFGPLKDEMLTEWGIVLLRRGPHNDRGDLDQDEYVTKMYGVGFNLDGRSPMVLLCFREGGAT